MSRSTRTLIPFVVACLLLCANGGRIATAQTVADDTANPPRIELEMILQKLHQQQRWNAEQQQRIDQQDKQNAQQQQRNAQQQQWNAQQNERINELEEEIRLLRESSDNELQQVPATDVSYILGAGHHNEDYGTSLSDLEFKVGTLWNAMPISRCLASGCYGG